MGEHADDAIDRCINGGLWHRFEDEPEDGAFFDGAGWFPLARRLEARQVREHFIRLERSRDLKRIAELATKFGLLPKP